MRFRELTEDERRTLYYSRLVKDFSADELKPFELLERLCREGKYLCLGFGDGEISAYAYFLRSIYGDSLLLDYLAVDSARRGAGTGTELLEAIKAGCAELCGCVYGEVEDPAAAPDEDERGTRERRIRFYERAGFRTVPLRSRLYDTDFVIMALSFRGETDTELLEKDLSALYIMLYGEKTAAEHTAVTRINPHAGTHTGGEPCRV